jgi:hypothetical protein
MNDALKVQLSSAQTAIGAARQQFEQNQQFQREVVLSSGLTLSVAVALTMVLYFYSGPTVSSQTEFNCLPLDSKVSSQFSSELLIVSRQQFEQVFQEYAGQRATALNGGDIYAALQSTKSRMSYYQILSIVQTHLLPEITFGLVAACMATALVFTALVGAIVPRWKDMGKDARFGTILMVMILFLLLGLYLSSLQDAIDIPAGVFLTLAVLCCPLLTITGFQLSHDRTGRAGWMLHEPEWCAILSSISVIVLSAVLLHTVAFAPLAIVALVAVSALLWVLLRLGAQSWTLSKQDRSFASALAIYLVSLLAWRNVGAAVVLLQPRRQNAIYSLATDVANWLDWGLMLTAFVWYMTAYVMLFYGHTTAEWATLASREGSFAPMALVNFAHVTVSLLWSSAASGVDAVTVGAFAHLCGVHFAVEAFALILFNYHQKDAFGVSELACALNVCLLFVAKTYSYSMSMVLSVLNVTMYILLKFGVPAAMLTAALAIVAATVFR